ncbi:MAG: Rieske (2Fe-2S) protein [Planctomycetota bacterium]
MSASNDTKPQPTRRGLLSRGLAAAAGCLVALPAVGALLDPLFRSAKEKWRDLGPAADLADGATKRYLIERRAGWQAVQEPIFLVRRGEEILALSSVCTHLGCRVRAHKDEFRCPCHQGAFTKEGEPLRGPVTEPLARYTTRIERDRIQVRL